MIISKRSPLTGTINEMDLDISQAQYEELTSQGRRLIQEIVPNLTKDEREFLMTGYTADDWLKMFPPKSEEDEESDD